MNKVIMNRSALLVSLALAAIPLKAQVATPTPVSTAFPGVPQYDHIVVVIEENKSYSDILAANPPYIMGTLSKNGAALTNSYSVAHPSEPNYFALYAGDTFGITDDNNYNEPDPSLATILAANGLTFTGYVESASTNTGVPDGSTLAVRKHNPWESFPERTTVERDFSAFPTNAAGYPKLPKVSFVIPNADDDMHNGTISQGDTWLSNHLGDYAQWALTHNSLLIVTWDEDSSEGGSGPTKPPNNQILTLFYGQYANGLVPNNVQITHYNVLATILTACGVPQGQWPRYSANANPITQVFTGVPPTPVLVWENTTTGQCAIWLLKNGALSSSFYLPTVRVEWRIAGVGDFNGDGNADLVWEDTSTGQRAIWLLKNGALSSSFYLPTVPSEWHIAGAGDFNGDGFADLVWENTSTGQRAIWFLKNGVFSGSIYLPTMPVQWHIAGVGDFNGDGNADLVWENTTTGQRAIWLLKNGVLFSSFYLPTVPIEWHIAGAGDFNGDGNADLVWENTTTGERAIWLLKNGVLSSSFYLPTVPVEWKIENH